MKKIGPNPHKKQIKLNSITLPIDYTSRTERKAWQKKWEIMQTLWGAHKNSSDLVSFSVPVNKLTEPSKISEIDSENILNIFTKIEGVFSSWKKEKKRYFFKLGKNTNRLTEVYGAIKEIYETFAEELLKSKLGNNLMFYPVDGIVRYKNQSAPFKPGTKAYELLKYFWNGGKNTLLTVHDIQQGCNKNIRVEKYKFKGIKDISDTIEDIQTKLNVKNGEDFPFYKHGESFILAEK